jgi:hypothetical protein
MRDPINLDVGDFEHALLNFEGHVAGMGDVVRRFGEQVDRMRELFAMQAANQERLSKGLSIAYPEAEFMKI